MKVDLLKLPTRQEQNFINASEPEQLYGGAKRGGKSVGLCMKMVMLASVFPGNRGLLARQDFTDLRDSTLVTFFQVCPPALIRQHHKGDRCIWFHNDSHIIYRGLGDAKDFEKSKGIETGFIGVDEPSEISEKNYLMINSQLNWVLPSGHRPPYMAMLASNPEPGWVLDRFRPMIEEYRRDKSKRVIKDGSGRVFIPALPKDNPHLPAGWEASLRADYPADWVEKYLDGSWSVSEGTVFTELDDRVHFIRPFDYSGLKLYASVDHASTGITCMLIVGVDADDNFFAIGEYYVKNRLITEHAEQMRVMLHEIDPSVAWEKVTDDGGDWRGGYRMANQGRFQYFLIDPSTTAKTVQEGRALQSINDLYLRQGIPVCPAWNAVEMGIEHIKELIHIRDAHIHPLTQQRRAPALFIVSSKCPNLCREMQELTRQVNPLGNISYKGTDHAIDNLRYIVNSMPPRPEYHRSDVDTMTSQDQFALRAHSRWANSFGRPPIPENSWM